MKNPDNGSALSLAERQDRIMSMLREMGSVPVTVLAEQLKVSDVTIRKDLNSLEKKNMLYRSHGSAILINPYINEPSHQRKGEAERRAETRDRGLCR